MINTVKIIKIKLIKINNFRSLNHQNNNLYNIYKNVAFYSSLSGPEKSLELNPNNKKFSKKGKINKIKIKLIKNKSKVNNINPSKSKKNNKTNRSYLSGQIRSVPITFVIILNTLAKEISLDVNKSLQQVTKFHDDMIKNHGIVEGTARFNKIRLYCILLLEGQNPEPLERVATSYRYKWPSGLCELLPFYMKVLDSKCTISDRIIRSILYLNRLCNGNGVLDTKTIIREHVLNPDFVAEFKQYLDRNVEALSGDKKELNAIPSTRVTSNGPNGKPKWQTAELEAYTLLKSEYNVHFRKLCEVTDNMPLYKYMEERASQQSRVDRKRLRYITAIRDKGNKSRAVAISDYWTQVLLEPIMRDIQSFTSKRWRGVSYAQSHIAGFESFKKRIKPGDRSYDLTAWTDGLPAVLQRMVLESRYGKELADAWFSLVVDCNWDVKGSKTSIKYGTGQGMGTAGSFDIATLTDLELLNMVYLRSYQTPINKHNTTKVGDDLVIFDPQDHIYNYYVNDLGMEINKSKTKYSTYDNICGEFVSRNINNGKDVSRISANICRAVKNNILDLPQLANHLQERGVDISIPLPAIFTALKIKGNHKELVLRTLYLLCLVYEGDELMLLKNSIKDHYFEFIAADKILSVYAVNKSSIEEFRKLYMVYQVGLLLNSIKDKLGLVMDGITDGEIPDSISLREESELTKLWRNTDMSIDMSTSIVILSRSFTALNEMYGAESFSKISEIVQVLSKTEQHMTFKELGVISTNDKVWRPKCTRLFNLIKSLDSSNHKVLDYVLLTIEKDKPYQVYNSLVECNILLPYDDPIFKGIDLPVIGKSDKYQP